MSVQCKRAKTRKARKTKEIIRKKIIKPVALVCCVCFTHLLCLLEEANIYVFLLSILFSYHHSIAEVNLFGLEKSNKVHCSSVAVGGDVTNIVKGKLWSGIIESI